MPYLYPNGMLSPLGADLLQFISTQLHPFHFLIYNYSFIMKSYLLVLLCGLLSLYTALAGTNAEGKLFVGMQTLSLFLNLSDFHTVITTYYLYYSWHYCFMCTSYCHLGLAYLEAKGKEEGVVTLPSGLMYKEIREGNGKFII